MNGRREGFAFVSPLGRRWDYLHDRRLTCPDGHRIHDSILLDESGYIGCVKPLNDSRGIRRVPCGKWIFILWIRGAGNIVVEVNEGERDSLRSMASVGDRINYLGIPMKAVPDFPK